MSFLRHLDEESCFDVLNQACNHKDKIIGVGLDSSEKGNPPSKFKKLFEKAISDAVGDKLEIILDGGIRRGTHVLKALAAGAKACSFGRMFLFGLSVGGQKGVEKLLKK